jgi:dTDP-4-amino-4,6-dideoxygalactose transaminase
MSGPPLAQAARIPFVRPDLPPAAALIHEAAAILDGGVVTKGPRARAFEDAAASLIGSREVVAVSSCTVGLALVLRSLASLGRGAGACRPGQPCPIGGHVLHDPQPARNEVILPSFIFLAAPAAVVWAGLEPVFVDVCPEDYTVSAAAVEAAITERTAAVIACHTFGCPCDTAGLRHVTDRAGVPLVVDAAHALGTRRDGRQVGADGLAEVFSLSPTKLVVAGEGGLVATSCGCLANLVRMGREYGNDGRYGCWLPGLNGRLPELSALVGQASLARLEEVAARRAAAAAAYAAALADVPGIGFQRIPDGGRSSWKDFTIAIDPQAFGMDRDAVRDGLAALGIETRAYFSPPCHRMEAFRGSRRVPAELPVTDRLADTLLALPMGVHVTPDVAREVAAGIASLPRSSRSGRP